MLLEKGLEGSAKDLYNRLFTTEFDPVTLRKDLEEGKYDAEAINSAALEYVDDCSCQLQETEYDEDKLSPGETIPWIESGHMKEALELLLNYGLDPNRIFQDKYADGHIEEYNIMQQLQLIDNGYQGTDSLYLLLNHGGNPNLVVDGEHLLSEPYYDLWFDTVNRDMLYDSLYNAKVHYCMVLIGFGATTGEGQKDQLDSVDGFDLSNLRDHWNYYVGAIHSDKSNDGMELCFFDKHTNWEVARF